MCVCGGGGGMNIFKVPEGTHSDRTIFRGLFSSDGSCNYLLPTQDNKRIFRDIQLKRNRQSAVTKGPNCIKCRNVV